MARRVHWGFFTLVLVLLFALSSCGRSGGEQKSASTEGEGPPAGLALPSPLRELPQDRLQPWERLTPEGYVDPASAKTQLIGSSALLRPGPWEEGRTLSDIWAGSAVAFGASFFQADASAASLDRLALRLMPDASPIGWAIYRLAMGGDPPAIVGLEVNLAPGQRYWVALANYGLGRWQWRGPYTQNHLRILLGQGTSYLSPLGNLFVAIVTPDLQGPLSLLLVHAEAHDFTDRDPPDPPTDLTAQPVPGGIYLSWSRPTASDLAGYRLYWSTAPFTDPAEAQSLLGDRLIEREELLLPIQASGGELHFAVAAVDDTGNQSPLSAPASAAPLPGELPDLTLTLSPAQVAQGIYLGRLTATTSLSGATFDLDPTGEGSYTMTGLTAIDGLPLSLLPGPGPIPGFYRPTVRMRDADGRVVGLASVPYLVSTFLPPSLTLTATPRTGDPPLALELVLSFDSPSTPVFGATVDIDGDGFFTPMGPGPTPLPAHRGKVVDTATLSDPGVYLIQAMVSTDPPAPAPPRALVKVVVGDGEAPIAQLTATPEVLYLDGVNPQQLTLDASASLSPLGDPLEFAFDPTGRGAFAPFASNPTATFNILQPGLYQPLVKVRDSQGRVGTAAAPLVKAYTFQNQPLVRSPHQPNDLSASLYLCGLFSLCRAAVYHNWLDNTAYFIWQPDPDPTSPWSRVVIDDTLTYDDPRNLSFEPMNFYFMVSYIDDGLRVKLIRGSGDPADPWSEFELDSTFSPNFPRHTSLARVDGTPAVVFVSTDTGYPEFTRSASADGSGPWSGPSEITTLYTAWMPDLEVVDGNPAVAWASMPLNGCRGVVFARNGQPNGQGIWDITEVESDLCTNWTNLRVIGGLPMIAYYDEDNDQLKLAVNGAADGSGSWQIQVIDSGIISGVHLGEIDGNPAVAYFKLPDGTGPGWVRADLKLAINSQPDASGSWSISDLGFTYLDPLRTAPNQLLSLSGINPSLLSIFAFQETSTRLDLIHNDQPDASGIWSFTPALTGPVLGFDQADVGYTGLSLALSPEEKRLFFAYYHDGEEKLYVGSASFDQTSPYSPGLGATGIQRASESVRDQGIGASLAIIGGRPAVSFIDRTQANLYYSVNESPDGSGSWNVNVADASGSIDARAGTSLAEVAGSAAIAYARVGGDELNFIRNTDPDNPSSWSRETVDAGGIYRRPTLAVVDGRPAIAYRDITSGHVKYAIAPNPDGTGLWYVTSVDTTAGDHPTATSLAVVDGVPLIAYIKGSTGALMVAKSLSPDGTGSWDIREALNDPTLNLYNLQLLSLDGRPAVVLDTNRGGMLVINTRPDLSGEWRLTELVTSSTSKESFQTFSVTSWDDLMPMVYSGERFGDLWITTPLIAQPLLP